MSVAFVGPFLPPPFMFQSSHSHGGNWSGLVIPLWDMWGHLRPKRKSLSQDHPVRRHNLGVRGSELLIWCHLPRPKSQYNIRSSFLFLLQPCSSLDSLFFFFSSSLWESPAKELSSEASWGLISHTGEQNREGILRECYPLKAMEMSLSFHTLSSP